MEVWKDIEGYENYAVSNLGRVKSLQRQSKNPLTPNKTIGGKIMIQNLGLEGYSRVGLRKIINGKSNQRCFFVHRLVAFAFIENKFSKIQVNHIDGIKTNNFVQNLEWCTPSENIQHAISNGLKTGVSGEKNGSSKLTNNQVRVIREKYSHTKENFSSIARKENISQNMAMRLMKNETYKNV